MKKIYFICSFVLVSLCLPAQQISLSPLASYHTGVFDEGAAEIVAFDVASQRLFFTNANDNSVTILSIADPNSLTLVADIDMSPYGDGVNSLDVHDGLVAVAVVAQEVDAAGSVVFMDTDGGFVSEVQAGVLPDMLLFTEDGLKVLVANEGQPSDDYAMDPEGSVTIVDLAAGAEAAVATQVSFSGFIGQEDALRAAGIRIFGPGANAAQDLEPEYMRYRQMAVLLMYHVKKTMP